MVGATGGQAMKEKQNQMAGMYQAQFERGIQERKATTEELTAQANMISAEAGLLSNTMGGGVDAKLADLFSKFDLKGSDLNDAIAYYKATGKMPNIVSKGKGYWGLGVLGGPLGVGQKYSTVDKNY
jgi:hypothetical protein